MTAGPTPLWLWPDPLVLASGSVTRRLLLESSGIPVRVRPATIDERAIERPLTEAGQPPAIIGLMLARAKAHDVAAAVSGSLVLGADQTLALGGRQLHKPASIEAARQQLGWLAGTTHVLHSAVVLVQHGTVVFETIVAASLTMRPLSASFIDCYLAATGPAASASVGGYQLEGLGIHLFERIQGDQSTILGLPLLPLLAALRRLGALAT